MEFTTDNSDFKTIATHDGPFHADDVFAVSILSYMSSVPEDPRCRVTRTRKPEIYNKADIVVDVGHVYDPENDKFDHHQKDGVVIDGRSYSSVGLVWKKYGIYYTKLKAFEFGIEENFSESDFKRIADKIDETLIKGIDFIDTGEIFKLEDRVPVKIMSVSGIISSFNPVNGSTEDYDYRFEQAVEFADQLLSRMLDVEFSLLKTNKEVLNKIEETVSSGSSILFLEKFAPWQNLMDQRFHNTITRVVFPALDGGWRIQQTKWANPFPVEWQGLENDKLKQASGIETMIFCHNNGFICGVTDRETAIYIANSF